MENGYNHSGHSGYIHLVLLLVALLIRVFQRNTGHSGNNTLKHNSPILHQSYSSSFSRKPFLRFPETAEKPENVEPYPDFRPFRRKNFLPFRQQ